jgi:hypothetical protein
MSDRPIPKPGEDFSIDLDKETRRAMRRETLNRRLDDVLAASQRTLDLLEQDKRDGLAVNEDVLQDLKTRMERIRSRWQPDTK